MLNPQFGSGVLYMIPNAGNLATNPTPLQVGLLQDVQLEIKGDTKELYDNQQIPAAIARGKIKVSGKGKFASLDPMFYSQLYFGLPTTTGVQRPVFNEPHSAVASLSPTQATATVDLGVIITGGTGFEVGTQMQAVNAAPTVTGTYHFTPGPTATYAFLAADVTAGLTVNLNYTWPDTSHGITLALPSQLMGYAPQFAALLYNDFKAQMFAMQLNACVLGGISIPTKQEDFWVSDFDFSCSRDSNNMLGYIYADQN
jgi:hypothetical protein